MPYLFLKVPVLWFVSTCALKASSTHNWGLEEVIELWAWSSWEDHAPVGLMADSLWGDATWLEELELWEDGQKGFPLSSLHSLSASPLPCHERSSVMALLHATLPQNQLTRNWNLWERWAKNKIFPPLIMSILEKKKVTETHALPLSLSQGLV